MTENGSDGNSIPETPYDERKETPNSAVPEIPHEEQKETLNSKVPEIHRKEPKETLNSNETETPNSKATYRFKVWNNMESKNLVRFPRPCRGRIPNFLDCFQAAEKLSSEDSFKKAQVISVNLDTPQEGVRFKALEAGKTLLVPMAGLTNGFVMKVNPPPEATRHVLRNACKRRGVDKYGEAISSDDKIHIDILVLGSVAVSKDGHRIGKGGGFSDLDYALMSMTGIVTEDTLIVTTVHDEQIFESLSGEMFEPFDVPVDMIITPTQIIEVNPRLPRPEGIKWNLLSNRRMETIPLLKTLREKEIQSGKDCTLKETDSDRDERTVRPLYRPFYRRRQRYQTHSQSESRHDSSASRPTRTFRRRPQINGTNEDGAAKEPNDQRVNRNENKVQKKVNDENRESHQRRPYRLPLNKSNKKQENGFTDEDNREVQDRSRRVSNSRGYREVKNGELDKEDKDNIQQRPFRKPKRRFIKTRLPVDFSVKIGNIGSSVRVRDLKAALIEKGVRPRTITWKGPRGFAFLHFAKIKDEPEQPTAVDDVIASLQGLTVKYEKETEMKETLLSVEPAKPISRIENVEATAV